MNIRGGKKSNIFQPVFFSRKKKSDVTAAKVAIIPAGEDIIASVILRFLFLLLLLELSDQTSYLPRVQKTNIYPTLWLSRLYAYIDLDGKRASTKG